MDFRVIRCGSVVLRTVARGVAREAGSRNVVVRDCWSGAVEAPLDLFVVDILE